MKLSSYVIIFGLVCTLSLQADRIYVNSAAAEGGDGTSWASAYKYLQDGLNDAKNDDGDEIWVAAGTYYPDEGNGQTDGDREARFLLRRTNTLYGGFAGTETSLDQRDIETNVTILSGEISVTKAEWSRHVMRIINASIDGITITKGNANGAVSPDNEGGAVDAVGTITANKVTFIGNCAKIGGVAQGGTWIVTDCTFDDNEATEQGGVGSGGNWTVSGSVFSNNSAPIGGVAIGGIWDVTDSEFSTNVATTQGGVAHVGTWTVTGSSFSNNSAPIGGVANSGTWTVTDTVVSGNSATTRGGVANNSTWTTLTGGIFSGNNSPLGGVAHAGTWNVADGVFTGNEASTQGGVANLGIWEVSDSVFSGNSSALGGVARGSEWKVKNTLFELNEATTDGGVASAGTWNVANSFFVSNSADRGGVSSQGVWTVANSVFVENTAVDRAGIARASDWTVTNSTFYKNTADIGGVARGGTWLATNNIFFECGNAPLTGLTSNSAIYEETPTPDKERAKNILDFNWSGGDMGEGFLINADPLFVDETDPDGPDDTWGTADDGLRLLAGSPAIGEGNTTFLQADTLDVDGDEDVAETTPFDAARFDRILDSTLDLGAYEYAEPPKSLTLVVTPVGTGTVSESGNGLYEENATATLTATPAEGYLFDQWQGDATGTDNPYDLLMDGDKTVTAVFAEIPPVEVTLTLAVDPVGAGTVNESGDGSYEENTTATLEAIPAEGFVFDRWEGDLTGSDNPDDLLMDTNKSVTAVFLELPKTLTLSVSPEASGSVNQSGSGSYVKDATATLEAIPAEGYYFVQWQGDASGTDNPLELVMDSDKDVTAVFALITYAMTTGVTPAGSGTVSESGSGTYLEGSTATLTANPAAGYFFDRWEGDVTGTDNPVDVTMDGDKQVTAVFEVIPTLYSLTTAVSPNSAGSVTESGDGTYLEGSTATLEAIPAEGFVFDRWEGDLTGSDNPDDLLMDTNKSVTAVFLELPKTLTLSVSPEASGSVNQSGSGSYVKDSTATLEAIPAEGYYFEQWQGDASGTDNPLELVMDSDKDVTAVFALITYAMTTGVTPAESGTVSESGSGTYLEGSTATLTANPAAGYFFDRWEGDVTGTDNPVDVTMDGDKQATAVFSLITYALTTGVSPASAGTVSESGSGTYLEGSTTTLEALPAEGYTFFEWQGDASGMDNPIELPMNSNKSVTAVFLELPKILASSVSPPGTGTINQSGDGSYETNSIAVVEAIPAEGYRFERWEGDVTGTDNPLEIVMDSDKDAVAVFAQITYALSTEVSPTDAGTVSESGSGTYVTGSIATLTATPAAGFLFDRWEGDVTGSDNPVNLLMVGDKEVTAVFSIIPPNYTLSLNVSPGDGGTVTESGDGTYVEGSIATLSAFPEEGYLFDRWEGDVSGSENPVDLTMNGDKTVTAIFVLAPPEVAKLTTTASPENAGTITDNGGGVYNVDSTATITAIPAEGYLFDHWEGDATGSENPTELLMDTDKQVTAVFVEEPPEIFILTTLPSPELGGMINEDGEGSYEEGTTATVEAVPAEGYQFDYWEGDVESTDNPLDILMDENKEVTAVFSLIPPSAFLLTATASPDYAGKIDGNDENEYPTGTTASIEAVAMPGYLFDHWEGDSDSTEAAIEVLMDAEKTVTAFFVKDLSDADKDGLTAFAELTVYGSNPNNSDTDGDGVKDGVEAGTIFNPAVHDGPTLQLLASNPEVYLSLILASSAVVPEILIEKDEAEGFMITIQIQKTDNLKDWLALDLTNAEIDGDTITLRIPASNDIRFIRSRTSR